VVDRAIGDNSVISKGLKEGEMVVVDGQIRLRPSVAIDLKAPVKDLPAVRPKADKMLVEDKADAPHPKPEKSDKSEMIK
jgi:hypothetical protein